MSLVVGLRDGATNRRWEASTLISSISRRKIRQHIVLWLSILRSHVDALIRIVEDILECNILLVHLSGVALLLEHGMEDFSMLISQDLHVSIDLYILGEESVDCVF